MILADYLLPGKPFRIGLDKMKRIRIQNSVFNRSCLTNIHSGIALYPFQFDTDPTLNLEKSFVVTSLGA